MKTLLILAGMGACLVALALVERKPCYVPDEQKIGTLKISELCGSLPAKPTEPLEHW